MIEGFFSEEDILCNWRGEKESEKLKKIKTQKKRVIFILVYVFLSLLFYICIFAIILISLNKNIQNATFQKNLEGNAYKELSNIQI